VCSVVNFSHTESLRDAVLAAKTETAVDDVSRSTCSMVVAFNTQAVVPVYKRIGRIAHVTDILKRHR